MRSGKKIVAITFEIHAQNWIDDRFSVPKTVFDALGATEEDPYVLTVTSSKGTKTFVRSLKSGKEVYGRLKGHIPRGDLLTVHIALLDQLSE